MTKFQVDRMFPRWDRFCSKLWL